ncbi:unnamed protein product [Clonostachys rosea]|uniref:Clr5 domain-containing protein n=1 Tax=Bionectria ochroleuca TaxID=29856 RepID=A0ABY6U8A6_BIOOC|nr:unnamed protein product [Clonostachys rosea]
MASSREIPDEVWSRHRDTILKLRFDENLPLDAAKSKSRNIVQVMKDTHGFEATAAKNLKRKDWETILPIYNDLEKRNLKPRLRLGDHILDEKKVKKARRYLTSDQGRAGESDPLLASTTQTRLWCIEVCRDGKYTDYSGRHSEMKYMDTSSSVALTECATDAFLPAIQKQSVQDDMTSNLDQFQLNTPNSQLAIYYGLSSPLLSLEDSVPMPNFLSDQGDSLHISLGSPHLSVGEFALSSAAGVDNFVSMLGDLDAPLPSPRPATQGFLCVSPSLGDLPGPQLDDISSSMRLPALGLNESQLILSKDQIDFSLQRVFQDPTLRLRMDVESISAGDILNDLQSLLYDCFRGQGTPRDSSLIAQGAIATGQMFKRVVFSIANNFAGLANIPRAIVLGILKNLPKARSDLVGCLQLKNVNFSKPLADNLFRAAVEAGDEELVSIILDTTSGQANKVDVNQIVCESGRRKFTALALAAYLHRPSMVRKLLEHGAKVGPTCNCPYQHYRNCQNYLIHDCQLAVIYGQYSSLATTYSRMDNARVPTRSVSEAAEIVRLILGSKPGAVKRSPQHPDFFMTTSSRLLELMVQAVPPDRHGEMFEPLSVSPMYSSRNKCGPWPTGLGRIVEILEPQKAKQAISTLLSDCKRMGCTPSCAVKNNKSLSYLISRAILGKKFEMADYLLTLTQPDQGNLAAAIRSRRPDLVDSFLEQGALNRGEVPCRDAMSHPFRAEREGKRDCRKSTTPLAEAIRLQDFDLMKRLEEYGALNRILNESSEDFAAALFATVEVGDCLFLKHLLSATPSTSSGKIHWVFLIYEAIELAHFDIAIALITHVATHLDWGDRNGSKINRPAQWGVKRTPLQQACEKGSFEMVEFLVRRRALINAPPAKDGGATALQLAAISGSVRIVEYLLNHGADIHAAPALKHGRTALEGAAEHGRISVLDILLSRGAKGYCKDDILKALVYAERERQRGCEERLKQASFWTGGPPVGEHARL